MSPHLPDAVMFDMDGTLVMTEDLWYDAEAEIMSGLEVAWGPEHQAELVGGPLEAGAEQQIPDRFVHGQTVRVVAERLEELVERRRSLVRIYERVPKREPGPPVVRMRRGHAPAQVEEPIGLS